MAFMSMYRDVTPMMENQMEKKMDYIEITLIYPFYEL